jgi:tRNA modification GTPase
MKRSETDTIAAIATPLGEGGISVIRISGKQAINIANRLFKGGTSLAAAGTHTAHFGKLLDKAGSVVDDVVVTIFLEPNSYTGESTAELSCHGGIFVTKRILELILDEGARHAEPGEFTKRAFLNGKLDLSQAEAVADLIHARSDSAHHASVQQLEGVLSRRIRRLRSNLIDSIGLLELELDFVEENLEFVDKKKFQGSISEAIGEIDCLLGSFSAGRIYREGVKVVIAGPPNAGKSSLLNALLESNRAIVTDVPGTTRDTIEEMVSIEGVSFRLVDTAGMRETHDVVEREGVKRAEDEARTGDIVLFVIDASKEAENTDWSRVQNFSESPSLRDTKQIFVLNKADLPMRPASEVLGPRLSSQDLRCVEVSARTAAGLEILQRMLVELAFSGKKPAGNDGAATVTSLRHFEALKRSKESLTMAQDSLKRNQSSEFVAVDLRNALDCLGEVTGEVTSEEILNNIFSKFCVGK